MRRTDFMQEAIRLSKDKIQKGMGGPFGAVIVKNGKIISKGYNQVTSLNDPTAHAEIVAIRQACESLATYNLSDCEIYTSCEPCPMCMGAIYWSRLKKVYFGSTNQDAADAGFIDKVILEDISKPPEHRHIPMQQLMRDEALESFAIWKQKKDKKEY